MKAISAFVATILLVGFTVAVGAIISTWFLTYTRTTTAGVGSATACAAGMLDVIVPSISVNQVVIQTFNRGNVDLNNVAISVICDTNSDNYVIPNLSKSSINTTTLTLSGCNYSNVVVSAIATCEGGGTISGGCSASACRP
ncbi:MAG: hypothetical protein QXW01_02140 [Candidatus Aenigmatarchaeota archaeon]